MQNAVIQTTATADSVVGALDEVIVCVPGGVWRYALDPASTTATVMSDRPYVGAVHVFCARDRTNAKSLPIIVVYSTGVGFANLVVEDTPGKPDLTGDMKKLGILLYEGECLGMDQSSTVPYFYYLRCRGGKVVLLDTKRGTASVMLLQKDGDVEAVADTTDIVYFATSGRVVGHKMEELRDSVYVSPTSAVVIRVGAGVVVQSLSLSGNDATIIYHSGGVAFLGTIVSGALSAAIELGLGLEICKTGDYLVLNEIPGSTMSLYSLAEGKVVDPTWGVGHDRQRDVLSMKSWGTRWMMAVYSGVVDVYYLAPTTPPTPSTDAPRTSTPSTTPPSTPSPATPAPATPAPPTTLPTSVPTASPPGPPPSDAPLFLSTSQPGLFLQWTVPPPTVVPEAPKSETPTQATNVPTAVPVETEAPEWNETAAPGTAVPEYHVSGEKEVSDVSSAVALLSSFAGPTGVTSMAKIQIIRKMRCRIEDIDLAHSQPLDWDQSPLQLQIGDGADRYFMGAVIGNIAILAVVILLCHLYATIQGCAHTYGLVAIPAVFLIPGLLLSSIELVFFVGSVRSILVGIIGMLLVLGLPAALYIVVFRTKSFSAVVVQSTERVSRSNAFLFGEHDWVSTEDDEHFTHKYRACFESYNQANSYFLFLEITVLLAIGGLSAWKTEELCLVRNLVIVGVVIIYAGAFFYLQPYMSRFDNIIGSVNCMLIVCAVCLMTSAIAHDAEDGFALPKLLLIISSYLTMFKALMDLIILARGTRRSRARMSSIALMYDEELEPIPLSPFEEGARSVSFSRVGFSECSSPRVAVARCESSDSEDDVEDVCMIRAADVSPSSRLAKARPTEDGGPHGHLREPLMSPLSASSLHVSSASLLGAATPLSHASTLPPSRSVVLL